MERLANQQVAPRNEHRVEFPHLGRGARYLMIVAGAALALVFVVSARLATWYGIWRPLYVDGPSMWPALRGPHEQVTCEQCGAKFRAIMDPRLGGMDSDIRCPGCGAVAPTAREHVWVVGDRVLVDSAAYRRSVPRRGDVVAIARSETDVEVKRIIGLPGEQITLAEGDLWVDGQRYQKSASELNAVAFRIDRVTEFDDRSAEQKDTTRRWQWAPDQWRSIVDGWQAEGQGQDSLIVYRHESYWRGKDDSDIGQPVFDDYPWNQSELRALQPADDLAVRFRLSNVSRADVLVVQIWSRGEPWTLVIDRPVAGDWLVARCDGRWLITRGDRQVPAGDLPRHEERPIHVSPSTPVAFGGEFAAGARLTDVGVYRDLVLAGPTGMVEPFAVERLGERQYFVLGDNLPASLDSRREPGGVPLDRILGRVVPWR